MTRLLAALLVLLPTLVFAADIKPGKTRINNICTSYAMCSAQSGTGECVKGTDEIVHHVGYRAEYVFYSTKSTSTNYACDIYTSNEGFNGATATDQVNTTSITDEEPVYTMMVLLQHFWIACPTNDDNVVNIDVVICGR